MTRDELEAVMDEVFQECHQLYDAGQKEYARGDDNGFANFERVADHLGISREMALLVYAIKHLDGITAYVQGHESQREDVRGRINDLIVYLCILRGMIEAEDSVSRGIDVKYTPDWIYKDFNWEWDVAGGPSSDFTITEKRYE